MLYKSDITRFIEKLKNKTALIEKKQQEGCKLLWDKPPIDMKRLLRLKSIKLERSPYVYY